MLKTLSVVFIACLALVVADKVPFKDCGSKEGKIGDVYITPCPAEPCEFKKNNRVNVSVDFTAGVEIKNATNKVYGIIAGVKVAFPQPAAACDDMSCPVKQGATVRYNNSVFVNPSYPKLKLVVQWEVVDSETGQMVFCFMVPVQIVS